MIHKRTGVIYSPNALPHVMRVADGWNVGGADHINYELHLAHSGLKFCMMSHTHKQIPNRIMCIQTHGI